MNFHQRYKENLYKKIHLKLLFGRKVLDVGCGTGEDAYYLSKNVKEVYAFDVKKFGEWGKYKNKNLHFCVADAQKIPFKKNIFDGVFLKDVLHHVGEPNKVLLEIKRVSKENAVIVLVEGNRYNPLFYIHMTKMLGHEHLSQKRFKELILRHFKKVNFYHFESHYFPTENKFIIAFLKFIEIFMEKIPILNKFLSYNLAIINLNLK